jgi:hypothetical protein
LEEAISDSVGGSVFGRTTKLSDVRRQHTPSGMETREFHKMVERKSGAHVRCSALLGHISVISKTNLVNPDCLKTTTTQIAWRTQLSASV